MTVCPVNPLDPTAGNTKSGRLFDWESEAVEEYVILVELDELVEVGKMNKRPKSQV